MTIFDEKYTCACGCYVQVVVSQDGTKTEMKAKIFSVVKARITLADMAPYLERAK